MDNRDFRYGGGEILSTGKCARSGTFPQGLWRKIFAKVFHRKVFHIPQGLWKKIEAQRIQTQNADLKTFLYPLALWQRQHHREELMLAVMSRMLFCMLVSPFFRASSTLRMA